MHREFRKPLIIMTPKSLLRHKRCVSDISEFSIKSTFHRVLEDDAYKKINNLVILNKDNKIRKVVICSGKRYYDLKSGKRSLRVSIISGLCEGKLVAPLTFEGSCNRVVFEKWLGEKLLPQLKTGQLVILDNASFHKSQKVRELIESVNCELEYLPPYSPDLNEIEHYWFPIKNLLRKSEGTIENFRIES